MKQVMRGLTLAAVLLAMPAAQAEIVIDAFAGGTAATSLPAIGSDLNRAIGGGINRSVTLGGINGSIDIGSTVGQLDGFLTGNGSFLELSYDLTGAGASSRNFFVDQVLRTGLTVTSGTNNFTTLLTVVSAGATTATATWNGAINSQFNMLERVTNVGNGHLAAFASVDTLTLRITKIGGGNVFFNSTTGLTAIPEPATMSLLGLTALGGVFAYRRRKSTTAA